VASDTSLVFNIIARDKASAVFNKIREHADNTGKAISLALAPAAGPLAAGAAAGIVSVGAAMAGAGAAGKVYGAVVKSAFTEVQEASDGLDKTRDKIEKLGKAAQLAPDAKTKESILEQQKKAAQELKVQLAMLPPAQRAVVTQYGSMKDTWKGFVEANKPAVYAQMTGGFKILERAIPKLQPLFDAGSNAADKLLAKLGRFVDGGGFDKFVAFLANQGRAAFDNFFRIGGNVVSVIGKLFGAFSSNGPGVLGFLADASDKMRAWSDAGGIERLASYMQSQGPSTARILLDIATAAKNIAVAVAPLAPLSIAIAGALARLIGAVPPQVLTAIVAAFIAFNVALKLYSVYTLAAAGATKLATAAQWLWRGAVVGGHMIAATAQIAAYLVKVAAVRVATLATAAAQAVWNAAMVAGNFVAATAQLAAYLIKQGAVAVATKAMAAAQWLWNVAMTANPIGLIIAGIVLLVAGIVILWNKSAAFRNFWIAAWKIITNAAKAAWGWIKSAAVAVFNWFMSAARRYISIYVGAFNTVRNGAVNAWNFVKGKVSGFINWITTAGRNMGNRLAGIWRGLGTGFRSVVNSIIRGWNNLRLTIGGGSFMGMSIPRVTIDTPNIPYMAKGGVIESAGAALVGERGPELVHLSRGAQVTPLKRGGGMGGGAVEIHLRGEREIVALMRRLIRTANLLQEG